MMRIRVWIGLFLALLLLVIPEDCDSPAVAGLADGLPVAGNVEVQKRLRFQEQGRWHDLLGGTYGLVAYRLTEDYGLPHRIVRQLILVESGGDPDAVSLTGDHGLMQLNDILWPDLAAKLRLVGADPYDPAHNLQMGISHLAYLYHYYGDWDMTLTAYNRGQFGLQQYMSQHGTARSEYSAMILGY